MKPVPPLSVRVSLLLAALLGGGCVALPQAPDAPRETSAAAPSVEVRPAPPDAPSPRTVPEIESAPSAPLPRPAGNVAAEALPTLDFTTNVYFAPASSEIDARGRGTLQSWAEKLKANRDLRVALTGHTDHLGSREYNISLGQKRVEEVYRELIGLGVWSRQIVRRTSYGSEGGRSGNCRSAECRQTLRRVELNG